MTKEEILAMQPGLELDRLIAEKVLGWTIYHYDKDIDDRCYYMLMDENFDPVANDVPWTWHNGERKTEEEAWRDSKPFSTDISAAWEVVEKMQCDYNFVWHVWRISDDDTEACFGRRPSAWGKTAAEAICKAALLACMEV